MHGCCESDPTIDSVCFPQSKTFSFVLHFLSLCSQFPAISFESFAFCTRYMFLGLIGGIAALVLRVICV